MYIYAKRNKTGSCMHHDALSKDNSLCFLQVDTVILFKLLNLLENQGSTNMWHQCLIFPQKHKKLPVLPTMTILYITKDKKSFIITHWMPRLISFLFYQRMAKVQSTLLHTTVEMLVLLYCIISCVCTSLGNLL